MRIGIDFGTCFSSAAFMDGETLTLIKDSASAGSSYSVPSSVFVTPQKQILVGKTANNRRLSDPTRYRRELKRDLGKKQPLLLGEQSYLPEVLITSILGKIKRDADVFMTNIGQRASTGAVLTIPATYQQPKRDLMHKAAIEAGFVAEEVSLLEEPVAAALYYAQKSNMSESEIMLVYDLGGGTFDAALLQRRGTGFEYLALPAGIERCGGVDFDRAIYNDLVRQHPKLQSLLQGERTDRAALMTRVSVGEMCVDLKHQLSELDEAEISFVVPELGDFVEYHLTRSAFNRMIAPSVQETLTCCQQMLQQANIPPRNISRILLVGGSCRIPYVQQMLQQQFKRPLVVAPDLELVVCQGAVQYAAIHKIHTVSPTPGEADYTTISAALQQAQPMSQIILRPGTYREGVVLDREVELMGTGPVDKTIIESSTAMGIQMATKSASIRGVTLRHTSTEALTWHKHGAIVIAQGHLTLENCVVKAQEHAVSIWGVGSKATLRGCRVQADKNAGIAVNSGALGEIEDCEITESTDTGVYVRGKGSTISMRNSRVHDNNGLGISISSEGWGKIERCDISANVGSGIQVSDKGSTATIGQSLVHTGKGKGIAVWQAAQATIENCEIFANMHAGLLVGSEESNALLKKCKLHKGKYVGLDVVEKGRASLEECEIYGNAGTGIRVKDEGSQITISHCQIYEEAFVGIAILGKGHGILNNNRIHRNAGPGVRVSNAGSKATISLCDIQGNGVGVLVEDVGEAILKDSTVQRNRVDIYAEPGSSLQPPSDKQTENITLWQLPPKPEVIKLLSTFDPVRTLSGHTSHVYGVAISPDGRKIVSGSRDTTIKVWDFQTDIVLWDLTGHSGWVRPLAISPDGETLVSAGGDRFVKVWNLRTGDFVRTLTGHKGIVRGLAISPNGETLASGGDDKTIKIWSLQTEQELLIFPEYSLVYCLVIGPDGETLVSGSKDGIITIWNIRSKQFVRRFTGHKRIVRGLAISPNGETLASGSEDKTIKIWNLQTGELIRTLSPGHTDIITGIALSSDGQTLVSGSRDKTIKKWDMQTGQLIQTLSDQANEVWSLAISPDGQNIVTGNSDGTVSIWGQK